MYRLHPELGSIQQTPAQFRQDGTHLVFNVEAPATAWSDHFDQYWIRDPPSSVRDLGVDRCGLALIQRTVLGSFAALPQINSIRRSLPCYSRRSCRLLWDDLITVKRRLAGVPVYRSYTCCAACNLLWMHAAARLVADLSRSAHICTSLCSFERLNEYSSNWRLWYSGASMAQLLVICLLLFIVSLKFLPVDACVLLPSTLWLFVQQ